MNISTAFRNMIFFLAFAIPGSATADWLYFVSRTSDTLQRFDSTTFELESIGKVGFDYHSGGMAWDPESRKLILITDVSNDIDFPKLYLVDPFTANSELIGTVELTQYGNGLQPYGLEYIAETGQLLVSYAARVVEVDLDDLSFKQIASSESSDHRFGGLAYNSDSDKLYTFDSDGASYLVSTKGESIKLECQPGNHIEGGVAYDPLKESFWQTNLGGVNNQVLTRSMAPSCSSQLKAEDVGRWADNLAFVPDADFDFKITPDLNDAWYNPATDGQGFLLTVLPEQKLVFLAWFTYDIERPPEDVSAMLGDPGHRWLTAQGAYEGDTANLTIFVTGGGVFDSADPPAVTDPAGDGTIKLQFADCENGLIEYKITSLNLTGIIPIERIALDNVASCEEMINP
jgi:hypothetical protein